MKEIISYITNSCLPAKVYVIVASLNFMFTMIDFANDKNPPLVTLVGALFAMFLIALLVMLCNYLCRKGWTIVAWLICIIALLALSENLVSLNAPKKENKKNTKTST